MGTGQSPRDRLRAVIAPIVAAAGFDLEDLVVTPAGRRSMVRIVVDGDAGVSLDEVAEISRAVSHVLDTDDDAMGSSPYVLEVTSPGTDRPLTLPRHWRRAHRRLVLAQLSEAGQLRGRVISSDAESVVLDVDGTPRTLRYTELSSARVEVEFTHAAGSERTASTEEQP